MRAKISFAAGLASALACFFLIFCALPARGATILTGKVGTTVTRPVVIPFNAIIDEVLVKPGDKVDEGAPLVRYRLQDEAQRLLQRELTMGAGNENLESQILETQQKLATTIAERNKARGLVNSGLGSRQALARLEERVASYQDNIKLLKSGINKNNANFEARLKELSNYYNQPVKAGETLPDTLTLISPINGYVLYVDPALNPGSLFAAQGAALQVGQMNPMLVQVPVYEADINEISPGDEAIVEIPSLGNRQFTGTVNEISWLSSDMNVANPSYYTVELTVPNPDLVLKPGFKAVVRFEANNKQTR